MKILYQIPSLETVYAARFIYEGYRNAFLDLKHEFRPLTSNDNMKEILDEFKPDIFITSLNQYYLKFINLEQLMKYRKKGMVMFTQIRPWKKTNNQFGGSDLESEIHLVQHIKKGLAGDIFFHWLEQDDPTMQGFTKTTGFPFHTVLLAADTHLYFPEFDERFVADISYVGSLLPDKREFMKENLSPLFKRYKVKVYGSDWTLGNKVQGYLQKVGQYFNINPLKTIRKLTLPLGDEHKVYTSSTISLNIHEIHQRQFGSDFNERTFKILASGGFEITDNVAILRRYFTDKELVIAQNTNDWFEKIEYFVKYPNKRLPIIAAGKKKVLEKHTYHNRVKQFLKLYEKFK